MGVETMWFYSESLSVDERARNITNTTADMSLTGAAPMRQNVSSMQTHNNVEKKTVAKVQAFYCAASLRPTKYLTRAWH